jgi:perosamine synthetase
MMFQLSKPLLGKPELDAVQRVFDSGWLVEGKETKEFEHKIAEYVHAKTAVAFSNCTVALEMCLRAHNVKGVVAIPDFTHPATALAVINAKCTPVLCDVSLESFNINGCSEYAQTAVPVSWAGNPCTYYPYSLIVEDAACSLGSSYKGKMAGSEFTTCFSFHPRKLITCGEGAVATTNDPYVAEKLRCLKNFGVGGGNYRLSDVSCAVLSAQMDRLEWIISRRKQMAGIYDELLRDVKGVKAPKRIDGARQTFQTYAVFIENADRDSIIEKLKAKGIETQIGTYALHLLPQFSKLHKVNQLKNSELLHRKLLALPMSYDLTDENQRFVIDELAKTIND